MFPIFQFNPHSLLCRVLTFFQSPSSEFELLVEPPLDLGRGKIVLFDKSSSSGLIDLTERVGSVGKLQDDCDAAVVNDVEEGQVGFTCQVESRLLRGC